MINNSLSKSRLQDLISTRGEDYIYDILYPHLGYKHKVPTIDEFIESDDFLGRITYKGKGIYSYWRDILRKIFPTPYSSPYTTVMLRGAIGIGKSTIAKIIFSYDICKFLLMEDPHKKFNLLPSKEITFYLVSIQMNAAYRVLYNDLEQWLGESPFFKSHFNQDKSVKTLFKNRLNMSVGTRIQNNIGLDIPTAIIDEIQQEIVHNQVKDNYNSIAARIKSRFMDSGGELPGHVILCGSAGGADDFADWLTEKSRNEPDILIVEPTQWEVLKTKSEKMYSGKNFQIYAGDEFKDPFIIEGSLDPSVKATLNEDRILDVPIEYKPEFDKDIFIAIRDLAGISTLSSFNFITSTNKLSSMFTDRLGWFDKELYDISFFDTSDTINKYINLDRFKNRMNPTKPRFIHIDIGYATDYTGISCVHFSHFQKIAIQSPLTGETKYEWKPYIVNDFTIGLGRKPGEETPIFKIIQFIVELSGMGLNIASVSTDGFQSVQARQDLTIKGFHTDLISVDRTNNAYNNLKELILQERINSPYYEKLKKELKELKLVNGKVDHPDSGSKDEADSLAGAVYNACNNSHKYLAMESLINQTSDFDTLGNQGDFLQDATESGVRDFFLKGLNSTGDDIYDEDLRMLGL